MGLIAVYTITGEGAIRIGVIGQQAETVKEKAVNNAQNAAARRIERDQSQERLKLPPTNRSVNARASAGVTDYGKSTGAGSSARDQINRTESRVRSTIEGPVSNAPCEDATEKMMDVFESHFKQHLEYLIMENMVERVQAEEELMASHLSKAPFNLLIAANLNLG